MFQSIKKNNGLFFIAEVGQNHQGEIDNAIRYIEEFASNGAHAIKFQTRNNKYLFSEESYMAPYNSENAFAKTYGAHREHLEIPIPKIKILKDACQKNNVFFMSTPFDEPSLEVLLDLDVDIIKIASFDLGNIPFIDKIAKSMKPVVISIGGGNSEQIDASIKTILSYHNEVAILHCVSEYPCEFNRLGLSNILKLTEEFNDCVIGSSDHFNGTLSGPVARMLGANIFEKHVTFNRAWQGTDHSFALEPEGFRKFVRDTERSTEMLNSKPASELGSEPVFQKLGKSLIVNQDLKKGDILTKENLSGKIFTENFTPVRESNIYLGKKISRDIKAWTPVKKDLIED